MTLGEGYEIGLQLLERVLGAERYEKALKLSGLAEQGRDGAASSDFRQVLAGVSESDEADSGPATRSAGSVGASAESAADDMTGSTTSHIGGQSAARVYDVDDSNAARPYPEEWQGRPTLGEPHFNTAANEWHIPGEGPIARWRRIGVLPPAGESGADGMTGKTTSHIGGQGVARVYDVDDSNAARPYPAEWQGRPTLGEPHFNTAANEWHIPGEGPIARWRRTGVLPPAGAPNEGFGNADRSAWADSVIDWKRLATRA